LGYQSAWAQGYLPQRRDRNDFYTQVGKLLPPGTAGERLLSLVQADMEPAQVLAALA
jgi:class 3 adenylate cyclase